MNKRKNENDTSLPKAKKNAVSESDDDDSFSDSEQKEDLEPCATCKKLVHDDFVIVPCTKCNQATCNDCILEYFSSQGHAIEVNTLSEDAFALCLKCSKESNFMCGGCGEHYYSGDSEFEEVRHEFIPCIEKSCSFLMCPNCNEEDDFNGMCVLCNGNKLERKQSS